MQRIRPLGLALVAVFAISAVASASASAALPEFVHCVKQTTKKFEWTEKECKTKSGNKTGEFEKEAVKAGVGKLKFTSTSGKGTLETKGGAKVTCTSDTDKGELTGAKEAKKVVVTFKGCETLGLKCQTGVVEGEIVTKELKGTLGYINKTKKEVGLSLTPAVAGGPFVEFKCGPKEEIKVVVKEGEGKGGNSVIGAITPVNVLSKTFTLKFTQVKGVQAPEMFEGGVRDVLESSINGGKVEQSGEETEDTNTGEELIEIRA